MHVATAASLTQNIIIMRKKSRHSFYKKSLLLQKIELNLNCEQIKDYDKPPPIFQFC